MAGELTQRRCKGRKASGEPCRAHPLRPGTIIEGVEVSGEYCRAHDPALPSRTQLTTEDRARGGAATRKPRPTEVMRRLVEEHAEVVLAPHFRTLGYRIVRDETGELGIEPDPEGGAKIYGESKDGEIVMTPHDDLGAHLAAAEKLLDRVYGRPRQTTELSGPGGGQPELQIDRTVEREIERLRVKFVEEASPPELKPPPTPEPEPEQADDSGAAASTEPAPEPPHASAASTDSEPDPPAPEPEPAKQPRKPRPARTWLRDL